MNADIIEILEYIRETYHEENDDELKYRLINSIRSIEEDISKIKRHLGIDN